MPAACRLPDFEHRWLLSRPKFCQSGVERSEMAICQPLTPLASNAARLNNVGTDFVDCDKWSN
jgi:hypothetical protein